MNKRYNIFISHAWDYSHHYDKIVEFLDKDGRKISWHDHSVPKLDPLHTNGTEKDLYNALENKIIRCSVVVLLGGVYASCRKWIEKEVEIAKKYNKPIITVVLRGAERTSYLARINATEVVGWNSNSLISAIKQYG